MTDTVQRARTFC